jgi:hypothetical protein
MSRRLLLASLVWLFACGPAYAVEIEPPSYWRGALRKLGRGIANVTTCPLELARRREGFGEGLLRMAQRGVAGAFEILTFPAEVPANFEPIVHPEFVFESSGWRH